MRINAGFGWRLATRAFSSQFATFRASIHTLFRMGDCETYDLHRMYFMATNLLFITVLGDHVFRSMCCRTAAYVTR